MLAFAQTWRREATGGVVVDLPVGTSNEHAAAEAMRTIRSILVASGVPPDGIVVRGYQPPGRSLATIRITYPRIAAQAGPCGLWPEDIGPSFNRDYFENQPIWNSRLRHAAQPCRHGRQPGRPRAAARRDAGLYDAAHDGHGKISGKGNDSVDAEPQPIVKISDVGK